MRKKADGNGKIKHEGGFAMTVRESMKQEIDDTAHLGMIPGMMASIQEGIDTPLSECVPLSEVWPRDLLSPVEINLSGWKWNREEANER